MVRESISKCRLLTVVVLLGAVACQTAGAAVIHHKAKKTSPRQVIETLEEQWRVAQLAGDAAALDRLLSDDFVGINASGQVTTKSQQLARIRNRAVVLSQLEISDIKVKLIGPIVAVVTSRAEVTGTNEAGPIRGAFRYTRVYQRLAGGSWKITSFEATRAEGPKARAALDGVSSPQP